MPYPNCNGINVRYLKVCELVYYKKKSLNNINASSTRLHKSFLLHHGLCLEMAAIKVFSIALDICFYNFSDRAYCMRNRQKVFSFSWINFRKFSGRFNN